MEIQMAGKRHFIQKVSAEERVRGFMKYKDGAANIAATLKREDAHRGAQSRRQAMR